MEQLVNEVDEMRVLPLWSPYQLEARESTSSQSIDDHHT